MKLYYLCSDLNQCMVTVAELGSPSISRGAAVGGHCLSPAPPISRGHRPLHVPYYTGREHRVGGGGGGGHSTSPTIQVGDTEWGGGGGALHVPFCIGRGRGVGGATPRPLLLAGVNYKIM